MLANIAKDKDAQQQKRRANAVVATLARAWERLTPYANVQAAVDDRVWINRGTIESWWLCSAASIAWLPSEKGKATAPYQLRIKSPATVALYGNDPNRYLSPTLDTETHREVLTRIGVAGDPTATELIQRLKDLRTEAESTDVAAEDLAAPIYQTLASQVRGQRLGTLTVGAARAAFSDGDGLVATRGGWRRPSVVLAGPPIFGDMRDFVPSVSGTEALWELLGIPRPTALDARRVLSDLARKRLLNADETLIMLEALRLLVAAPESELAKLRRAAVWVGDRWERERPIYATQNVLIARVLKNRVSIWSPGGSLSQLDRLVDAYRLTRLDAAHGQVIDRGDATYNAELTRVFSRAVVNLQADLALSDPATEQRLRASWDELAKLSVKQAPNLRVRLVEPGQGLDETVQVDAWLALPDRVFYVAGESAIGSLSSGAYAVASVFDGDSRRVAHDWAAAWSLALEGHRDEEITTAARLDAERKAERDKRIDENLAKLAEQNRKRRRKGAHGRTERNRAGVKHKTSNATTKPTRQLVDPDSSNLANEDGEIIGGTATGNGESVSTKSRAPSGKLRDPDTSSPKRELH